VGKTVAVKQTIERLVAQGVPGRAIVRVAADVLDADGVRTVAQNAALPPLPDGVKRWWFL
jgi:hypothetical protein